MRLKVLAKLKSLYLHARTNRWYRYFYVFCRLALAYAFLVAGGVKVVDERFASGLSEMHPMGAYLTALHHTGFYYRFIGVAQLLAAVLLLIPRTVVLGALLYLPIIVNIFILTLALRFDGSMLTAPLMVLANLFVLAWHYDKWQYLLPFNKGADYLSVPETEVSDKRFPWLFFGGVATSVVLTKLVLDNAFEVLPRNSLADCQAQFVQTEDESYGHAFCACIHLKGGSLNDCLRAFAENKAEADR